MSAFIVKQPNGLYCRFSTIVDCPTHINMTREDYINYYMEQAKEEAMENLKRIEEGNIWCSFQELKDYFIPNNMTRKQFKECLRKMKLPKEEVEMEIL